MDMIRVMITGQAQMGRFPYRIDTVGTRLAAPYNGLSAVPLVDACRVLKRLGAADEDAVIGLFNQGLAQWRERTTINYGVQSVVRGKHFIKLKPGEPEQPGDEPPAEATDALKPSEGAEVAPGPKERMSHVPEPRETAIAETPARSSAAPPAPHRPPASPAGRGRAEPEPATPKSSHRKPKPKGSGGRQGRR